MPTKRKGLGKNHKNRPTAFKPGDPRINRKGKAPGTKNKFSGELKALVLAAAANAHPGGAQAYLTQQAVRNARSFLQLLGKLLPTQVTGEDGKAIELKVSQAAEGLSKLDAKELAALQTLLTKAGIAIASSEST